MTCKECRWRGTDNRGGTRRRHGVGGKGMGNGGEVLLGTPAGEDGADEEHVPRLSSRATHCVLFAVSYARPALTLSLDEGEGDHHLRGIPRLHLPHDSVLPPTIGWVRFSIVNPPLNEGGTMVGGATAVGTDQEYNPDPAPPGGL